MKRKIVLITGCEGMIGRELVGILSKDETIKIRKADLALGDDLRYFKNCLHVCQGVDEIYNCIGIKGSPKRTSEKPADFMVPMLQFNTNMLEAARVCNIKKFLYVSSIAVENPETDEFPSWAKLTGEKQIEAYRIQYLDCKTKYCIVRPCNVYGKESFKGTDSMVITSLIHKALNNDMLEVWGDGSQERDFINARDAAIGMIKCIEEMPEMPINLCSGIGVTIKSIAEIITNKTGKSIQYDITKPTGAQSRVMKFNGDVINWKPEINIKDGIEEIIDYLQKVKNDNNRKY